MGKANGIYQRSDHRWEARYKKGVAPNGRAIYGSVYGATREEAAQKRYELTGKGEEAPVSTELNLLILGAGSHGRDVMEIAESLQVFNKISFLDDFVEGDNIIGKCSEALKYKQEYPCAFVAIGDNKKRKKYAKYLKDCNFLIPKLISPYATISSNAIIGEGTAIMAQANVGACKVGDFCIIAQSSNINTDSEIDNYSIVDCGAIIMRGAYVGESAFVKSGEIHSKKRRTA